VPGVYISYPFCAQKCTYCNFASGVFPRELETQYVNVLRGELRSTAWPWIPETVYLGGGTPSLMEPEALAAVLAEIPGRPGPEVKWPEATWVESTMEAAPGNLTPERIRAWRAVGINRVSLGVQSFVQNELARTGRRHTAEIVAREIGVLRAAGIESINVDLIAGLPGQTAASFRESLDWVERLGVPHVSVYMLEVDEDSRLGRELLVLGSRYGAVDVPDEDAIADFYEMAVERLERLGIARYEISNFARPGFESRHNLKYWKREAYLGFGSDAHSFDGTERWQNLESPSEYVANPRATVRTPADPLAEKYFLGLRLREGVEAVEFGDVIERFIGDGLLERAGQRVRLTPRGVMLSNEVFAEFLDRSDILEISTRPAVYAP
jgi:oxygen-independent coproporphyrinogen III oxidase